jgi:hypothetical protein
MLPFSFGFDFLMGSMVTLAVEFIAAQGYLYFSKNSTSALAAAALADIKSVIPTSLVSAEQRIVNAVAAVEADVKAVVSSVESHLHLPGVKAMAPVANAAPVSEVAKVEAEVKAEVAKVEAEVKSAANTVVTDVENAASFTSWFKAKAAAAAGAPIPTATPTTTTPLPG